VTYVRVQLSADHVVGIKLGLAPIISICFWFMRTRLATAQLATLSASHGMVRIVHLIVPHVVICVEYVVMKVTEHLLAQSVLIPTLRSAVTQAVSVNQDSN